MRLSTRVEPLVVEPKGWGDNTFKGTLVPLQQRERERTKLSLSNQRHGTLYRPEEILHNIKKYKE
jgi:hypothetical protein